MVMGRCTISINSGRQRPRGSSQRIAGCYPGQRQPRPHGWVQENVERSRPAAGQATRKYMIDLVTIGEQALEISPGEGMAYIREETRRRYPEPPEVVPPDFDTWWTDNKADSNGWECAFVTAAVSSSIALGGAISVDPEYPLQTAMAELDRLEREGWRVLQVSEDRGLSTGLDGAEEARVIRVRYLLIAG